MDIGKRLETIKIRPREENEETSENELVTRGSGAETEAGKEEGSGSVGVESERDGVTALNAGREGR
jgi:hypothetical protein